MAHINDQNSKRKADPVFSFKLIFEICFSDALLATGIIDIRIAIFCTSNVVSEEWYGGKILEKNFSGPSD